MGSPQVLSLVCEPVADDWTVPGTLPKVPFEFFFSFQSKTLGILLGGVPFRNSQLFWCFVWFVINLNCVQSAVHAGCLQQPPIPFVPFPTRLYQRVCLHTHG